jgi:hypothetical protein
VESRRERRDRKGFLRVGRTEVSEQTLNAFAQLTEIAQFTLERSQLIVQAPQRSTKPVGIIEVPCRLSLPSG